MEKRKPHYNLADVQAQVARLGAQAFTKTALDVAGPWVDDGEMLRVVAYLSHRGFVCVLRTNPSPLSMAASP
jgi:motility quorum-sensing regulator / GCU-specific mRNA interferase toxin